MKYVLSLFFSLVTCIGFSQQGDSVDFKTIYAEIAFDTEKSIVLGKVHLDYTILKPTDSIFIDAKNMEILNITDRSFGVDFDYNGKQIIYKRDFQVGETYVLDVDYKVKPKKALYFINWNEDKNHPEYNPQIWTQGQGKYTSNWLPSIDDMNDKIIFDLSITFQNGFEVIANGDLTNKVVGKETTKWIYSMKKPMSSYLVALAIGKYDLFKETSKSGIPLSYYYYPKDSLKAEPTYRYSLQLFNFLENEIGYKFPWQNYKQVPVKDFLYSGMENTSCTIFSDAFVVDPIGFNDFNYVNVNAHELAHQWFGDLVTEVSGTHHWLQEGFATYYALLAEKAVFGEDYYYETLYKYSQELLNQDRLGQSTSLLNPKSSSVTFYKKGAWALHILREKVGDKAFKQAVKSYLEKYQFKNVETQNFIAEVETVSGLDLTGFVQAWLKDSKFYISLVEESLMKSDFYSEYVLADCEAATSKCKDWLKAPISDAAKTKLISQKPELVFKETFKNSLKVRQAIVKSIKRVPSELQMEFESLLKDDSYITIESTLYKLWVSFPKKRAVYLNLTKDLEGINGKNVRQLWLALALNTENYENDKKRDFYNELVGYTNSIYDFNTRENAFSYLRNLNAFNAKAKANLIDATVHHNWRFKSFAKELLKELNNPK